MFFKIIKYFHINNNLDNKYNKYKYKINLLFHIKKFHFNINLNINGNIELKFII